MQMQRYFPGRLLSEISKVIFSLNRDENSHWAAMDVNFHTKVLCHRYDDLTLASYHTFHIDHFVYGFIAFYRTFVHT